GVMVEHRNTVALVHWAQRKFPRGEWDRPLASSSICFDASITEMFVPLASGGCMRLVKDILDTDAAILGEVTMITAVPSAIETLLAADKISASVKSLNLGGELLQQSLVDELYAAGVDAVHDLYGPTEHTTYSTCCLRTRRGKSTIGRPLDNTRLYVLDVKMQPVPIGVIGELYIGGHGLTRGYLNRPELTARAFVVDPFAAEEGARLYRTGDLVRYLRDGSVEYVGRADNQVKVRGFRIEMGEIENQLSAHPLVRECAVVTRDHYAHRRIIAYYVPGKPTGGDAAAQLREHLRAKLPKYFIPDFFVAIDAIPLTPSGKKNRKALAERELAPESLSSGEVETTSHIADEPVVGRRAEAASARSPATVEQEILDLWLQVLETDHVNPDAGFFEAGGNSLLALTLTHQISKNYDVKFKVSMLFKYPKIRSIAEYIQKVHADA
ncbi:MAG TPA: non-ribosomal peptide synthetase, partial [Mycoplana sp.]|nr:non-ribosomal peptide synthetase [Mycoplana sp.]